MLETIAAVQAPLIGAVLIWAATVKLFTRRGRIRAQSSALSKLIGAERTPVAYRVLGGVEALVGAALVVPQVWWVESAAVLALSAGFAGYLVYARVAAPESSCGCMSAKHMPISWRGFSRSGWMLATGAATLWGGTDWLSAVAAQPGITATALVLQAALFVSLSPEFDGAWLIPLRRLKIKVTKPLGGDTSAIPLEATVSRLHRDDLYRHVSKLLRTDVRDYWDDGEWRIVNYGAEFNGRTATAVFAIPLKVDAPESIRVAFVDDETAETLLHLDQAPADEERPQWALPVGEPAHTH